MWATFKLQNLYFWKTLYGPILTIILPIILLAVLGNIFHIEYVLPGIIAAAIMIIGLLLVPLGIMELKNSSIFKYIGSSPISTWRFTFVTILYYAILCFATTIILLLMTMGIFSKDVWKSGVALSGNVNNPLLRYENSFSHGVLSGIMGSIAGSFSFLFSIILHISFSLVLGFLIATFAKTPQQGLTVGLVIVLPSLFLSGMVVSVDVIAESDALNWVSRFTPFRYTTGNLVVSSTPLDYLGTPQSMLEKMPFYRKDPSTGKLTVIGTENLWKDFIETDKTLNRLLNTSSTHLVSNNNVFDWLNDWGAIKVPSMTKLRSFVQEYLNGEDGGANSNVNRFNAILENMKAGRYDWLDAFFKQSNLLYFKAERGLAIMMPLVASGIMGYVVQKNFAWSTR